jgi:hypothetical protein
MRTFAFVMLAAVAVVGVAGCGNDDSTAGSAVDMSMRLDLSGQPTSCGEDGVALSCASASGNNACFVCDFGSGGPGVCARICSLVTQICPAGQTCHEFAFGDGGSSTPQIISVEGSGCGGFGYCH